MKAVFKKKKSDWQRTVEKSALTVYKISQFFVSASPTTAALESSSQLEVGLLPDTSNIAASAAVRTIDSDDSRDSSPDKPVSPIEQGCIAEENRNEENNCLSSLEGESSGAQVASFKSNDVGQRPQGAFCRQKMCRTGYSKALKIVSIGTAISENLNAASQTRYVTAVKACFAQQKLTVSNSIEIGWFIALKQVAFIALCASYFQNQQPFQQDFLTGETQTAFKRMKHLKIIDPQFLRI